MAARRGREPARRRAAARGRAHGLPRPLLARGGARRGRPARAGRGCAAGRRRSTSSPRARAALRRRHAAAPRRRGRRAARLAVVAGGPGTGKTTHRGADRRAAGRAGGGRGAPAAAGRAGRRRPARRRRASTRPSTSRPRSSTWTGDARAPARAAAPPRCTACSAGAGPPPARRPVVVDETSMVSLSLMARLVEAVRPDARLVLVGDPGQLASIEAGAVLADVVGPAGGRPRMTPRPRPPSGRRAARCDAGEPPPGRARGRHRRARPRAPLRRRHRGGGRGDPRAATPTRRRGARRGRRGVTWIAVDVGRDAEAAPALRARRRAPRAARRTRRGRARGDAVAAAPALGSVRLLCAHRRGPTASRRGARASRPGSPTASATGARGTSGRPLLVTANDEGLRLYNGDTGVVVATPGRRARRGVPPRRAASRSARRGWPRSRPVHAMTIHKSQGSQFGAAAVLLPAESPILTRELLYTAVTRAVARSSSSAPRRRSAPRSRARSPARPACARGCGG